MGQLFSCRWVNKDAETMRPYDLEVMLHVPCPGQDWHDILSQVAGELGEPPDSGIRVLQQPSDTNGKQGLFEMGPIYIEVKSSAPHSNSGSEDGAVDFGSKLDLCEISLHEAVFASNAGWRYHLLRVRWPSKSRPDAQLNRPRVMHIPYLSQELKMAPLHDTTSAIKLCLAISGQ
ncbi:unnamed protein product [Protopolystoma xenopodis]|uniref:Uncharacterized protein n=1 Tax=Protopolystoma xenopodis TaxID=117903 RepID=A0A448WWF8_9PLAT|nr:unnamed protein product [Protopolystoma xenopodis]